jgi:hypothetical protein
VVTVEQVLTDIEAILSVVEHSEPDDGVVESVLGQVSGYIQGVRRAMPEPDPPPAKKATAKK